jgi:hypothetical protein
MLCAAYCAPRKIRPAASAASARAHSCPPMRDCRAATGTPTDDMRKTTVLASDEPHVPSWMSPSTTSLRKLPAASASPSGSTATPRMESGRLVARRVAQAALSMSRTRRTTKPSPSPAGSSCIDPISMAPTGRPAPSPTSW